MPTGGTQLSACGMPAADDTAIFCSTASAPACGRRSCGIGAYVPKRGKFLLRSNDLGVLGGMLRAGGDLRKSEFLEERPNGALAIVDAETLGHAAFQIDAPPMPDSSVALKQARAFSWEAADDSVCRRKFNSIK